MKLIGYSWSDTMNNFMDTINKVIQFILGDGFTEKRTGNERRLKRPRKRKNEKRKIQRRK